MGIGIDNNKYINHFINNYAIFALCFGFGNYLRIGFSINKFPNNDIDKVKGHISVEIMFFYWRIFIS